MAEYTVHIRIDDLRTHQNDAGTRGQHTFIVVTGER
jgi:hypothetical protein